MYCQTTSRFSSFWGAISFSRLQSTTRNYSSYLGCLTLTYQIINQENMASSTPTNITTSIRSTSTNMAPSGMKQPSGKRMGMMVPMVYRTTMAMVPFLSRIITTTAAFLVNTRTTNCTKTQMVPTITQPIPSATIACTHPTDVEVHMDQDLDYALLQSGSQQLTEHSNQYTGTNTSNIATATQATATPTITTSAPTSTVSVLPLTHATTLPRTSAMSSVPVVSTYNTEPHPTSAPISNIAENSLMGPTPAPTRPVTIRYTFDHPFIQNLLHGLTSLMHSKLYHQQHALFFRSAIELDRSPFFTAANLDINEQSCLSTTNQERWVPATKEYQTTITAILRDHHHSQALQEADDIEHKKSIILQLYLNPNFVNNMYVYSYQRALDRLHAPRKLKPWEGTKTTGPQTPNLPLYQTGP